MPVFEKTFHSVQQALVKQTAGEGTHDVDYVFDANNTYFSMSFHSSAATHLATVMVAFTEKGTPVQLKLFPGDVVFGPFTSIKPTIISNPASTLMIKYQEH